MPKAPEYARFKIRNKKTQHHEAKLAPLEEERANALEMAEKAHEEGKEKAQAARDGVSIF